MGKNEIDASQLPYSWFEFIDDIQIFYAGLNFASRNLLDSATGGTFMESTLGDATKLLDNIMANFSQWHTERSSSKKVHAIEEIWLGTLIDFRLMLILLNLDLLLLSMITMSLPK